MAHPGLPETKRKRLDALILMELFSDVEIARRLDISHTTVWRRRHDLYGDDGEKAGTKLAADERYTKTPVRCPDCGGLINVLPCRGCKVRRYMDGARAARELGFVRSGSPDHVTQVKQRQLFQEALGTRPSTAMLRRMATDGHG